MMEEDWIRTNETISGGITSSSIAVSIFILQSTGVEPVWFTTTNVESNDRRASFPRPVTDEATLHISF